MQSAEKGEAAGKLLGPGDMFGDYTVEKLLGKGGMGAVYLVRAPDGERYAVKVMFPEIAEKNPDFRTRFAREAEFAMTLRHKNLISVYDAGEDPDTGLCYIIMDYVPGGSVKDRLQTRGPIPVAEAVSITAQIALALELAHRHGVIHRDIKPDNIMFDADGTPKLADLGVAKFTDEAHKTTVTTTGMIIGTPAYMAPEQMMDSHHIDARADIYALGVVLYEMLTGKRPNEGSTAVELLAKALKGEPLPDVRTMRPEISAAVAHVLSLMCAPKPEDRPPTTLAVAQLLQQAVTGQLKLPKKKPRASDAQKAKRPFPVAACVMGALVLGAAVFGWRAWSARQKTTTGATGVSPVAAVTSTAHPTGTTGVSPVGNGTTGTTGVSPVGNGTTGTTGVSPVGVGASGTPRPTAVRGSGTLAASEIQPDALYCVVDLSAGPKAEKYPVSYLNAEPKGGWTDEYKTTKLVLRRIEPGTFKMSGKYDVTLTKAFYIGVFEVTQKQYELVTGDNPSASKGDMRPVGKVSWDTIRGKSSTYNWPSSVNVDSSTFMGKIQARTGLNFDLPTEAQWEYACRAGTTSKYNNGGDSEEDLKKLGRFTLNQKLRGWGEPDADFVRHEPDGKGGYGEGYTVVGSYLPNAWGLYDMHGNVWELCLDWSGELSGGMKDPVGSSSGSDRVGHGGCWFTSAVFCTSSYRGDFRPSNGYINVGFRLAIRPDLLKERGITLPVPNENRQDVRSPSAATDGLPKQLSKKPGPMTLDLGGGVKLEMVGCPAGTFKMSRYKGVTCQTTITRPFWISKTMVMARHLKEFNPQNFSNAEKVARAFPDMDVQLGLNFDRSEVCCAVWTRKFASKLPPGYICRLPTEAELEYAWTAGMGLSSDIKWSEGGRKSTCQLLVDRGWLPNETDWKLFYHYGDYRGIALISRNSAEGNDWGVTIPPGDMRFTTLDRLPGRQKGVNEGGGHPSIAALSYPEAATDPVRTCGDNDKYLHLARMARGRDAIWFVPSGFYLCIGPDLLKERGITPPVLSENGRSPSGADSPSAEPFKLLSERPKQLTITLGKGEQLELMGCPAGTFTMGCENGKHAFLPHQVTITRPFWMGKFPVTRAQWECLMPPSVDNDEMRAQIQALGGGRTPQTHLKRQEINGFIERLNKRHARSIPRGLVFRLPTLAEWEYACRANGDPRRDLYARSSWGDVSSVERAAFAVTAREKQTTMERQHVSFNIKYWDGTTGPFWQVAMTVGTKKPNGWGLYDMLGNQAEVVLDTFSPRIVSDVAGSFKTMATQEDIDWRGMQVDPLFWDGDPMAAYIRIATETARAWGEAGRWFMKGDAALGYCDGFRLVVGPDLVKERHGKPGSTVGGHDESSRQIEVFPRADTQTGKWKKRAPWRYTTKVPTADWAEPAFRDGTWKRTNKPLGFGKGAALMRMADRWTTNDLWLRRHFTWKAAKVTRVVFDMYHDENVEIFLNGTRILEEAGSNDRWEPFEVPVDTFTSSVREGDNVLAVKVHDGAAPRYFDCGLTVETEEVK